MAMDPDTYRRWSVAHRALLQRSGKKSWLTCGLSQWLQKNLFLLPRCYQDSGIILD